MKKTVKVLCIVLCVIMALSPIILAKDIGGVTVDPTMTGDGADTVSTLGNKIVGIIKVIGIFVSIGAIIVIGTKYMMGSAEEKAEYKKVMIPYLIGAVLVFAASAFAEQIYDFAIEIFGS